MDAGTLARVQFESWAALTSVPPSCGHGTAFAFEGHEVVHLHDLDEADLQLTAPVIARLGPQLAASTAVRLLRSATGSPSSWTSPPTPTS
ncbi:luciferase family protein [Streptacidiphilus monticola]